MITKLKNGLIPAHTECPYKIECNDLECRHRGTEHTVNYSCEYARAYDLIYRNNNKIIAVKESDTLSC